MWLGTDRPTDRPTDIATYRAAIAAKKYSEVHNLTIQGPGWNIDTKFGTEPIAQEGCFTESSG